MDADPVDILLLENIHPAAGDMLTEHGFNVRTQAGSLPTDDLATLLRGV